MRIIQVENLQDIRDLMRGINVDPYGIKIMLPKAVSYLIKINSLSNITANILKQEMLSLGADAAVSRGALTGQVKQTDCLLIGNLSQYELLEQKLNKQPFGLNKLAESISSVLNNYRKNQFILDLGRYKLNLGKRACIMGIINLTPDSFSGDGHYQARGSGLLAWDNIVNYAQQLLNEGADILDIGGESSRPGAKPVPQKEELARTIPAIKIIAKKIKAPISIDTHKPEVARQALDNGAVMVNDITALRSHSMAKVIARYKAGVVLMHMKGRPLTMQKNPKYRALIDEIIEFLDTAIKRALEAGIDKEKIVVDPGIGFAKTLDDNLEILKRLNDFKVLGRPILIGASRKSFIGKILNVGPKERVFGTVSSSVLAVRNGADIVRVHDVKAVKQALKVSDAIVR